MSTLRRPGVIAAIIIQLLLVAGVAFVVLNRSDDPKGTPASPSTAPTISPEPGNYRVLEVEFTGSPGSVFRYTTDGSIPGEASPVYDGPLLFDEDVTVKVRNYASGFAPSETVSATYVVTGEPLIAPDPGSYEGIVLVTMSPADGSVAYTLDGSTPTEESPRYTEPILVQVDTVVAAVNLGRSEPSAVTTSSYSITAAPDRVEEGLLALYTFDEGEGDAVVDQVGDPAYDLALIDPAGSAGWTDDLGGSLRLDSQSWVTTFGPFWALFNATRDASEVTVEVWARPAQPDQTDAQVVGVGPTWEVDSGGRNFAIRQTGDLYEVYLRTSETNGQGGPTVGTGPLELTGPQHLVLVRTEAGRVELWKDGQQVMDEQRDGSFENWLNGNLSFGGISSGENNWSGDLYLAAFYDRALTPDEIETNLRAGPAG